MSEEQLPDRTDAMPTDDMREQRLRKMKKIADAGGRPYGYRVDGIIPCLEAKQRFADAPAGTEVAARVAGRIVARRVMGKSLFANVQDQDGQMQLYIQKNVVGDEAYEFFLKELDIGDVELSEAEALVVGVDRHSAVGQPQRGPEVVQALGVDPLTADAPELRSRPVGGELHLDLPASGHGHLPVSYTHLTLPTIYSV